jgi:hypothetical protein
VQRGLQECRVAIQIVLLLSIITSVRAFDKADIECKIRPLIVHSGPRRQFSRLAPSKPLVVCSEDMDSYSAEWTESYPTDLKTSQPQHLVGCPIPAVGMWTMRSNQYREVCSTWWGFLFFPND